MFSRRAPRNPIQENGRRAAQASARRQVREARQRTEKWRREMWAAHRRGEIR